MQVWITGISKHHRGGFGLPFYYSWRKSLGLDRYMK